MGHALKVSNADTGHFSDRAAGDRRCQKLPASRSMRKVKYGLSNARSAGYLPYSGQEAPPNTKELLVTSRTLATAEKRPSHFDDAAIIAER